MDPIDEFLAQLAAGQHAQTSNASAGEAADPFAGSEPVGPANPAPPAEQPAVDVPAASASAIVGDVLNTSAEAALAELIRRVQAIEAHLRRNGADL